MPDLFGFSINRKKKVQEQPRMASFVAPESDDGATVLTAGGVFGHYLDLNGKAKSDIDLIKKYREMAIFPECEYAIDDIVNEAIITSEREKAVDIVLDDVDELSDNIKSVVRTEFQEILGMFKFTRKGHEIFRRWYIDSKLYYHMVVDTGNVKKGIQELRFIEPTKIRKIREVKKDKLKTGVEIVKSVNEYYIYNDNKVLQTGQPIAGGLKILPDSIAYVHSGMFDSGKNQVLGYLHKAIKPLNQLKMLEDAVVIYRISRAPERRIFYIDVGSLPKNKAEQYLRDIMNRYRNKLVYDASTGEIRDDKRHMSMLEDFWMPRREGGRGTEIQTLDGGQNLGEMEDVEYFQKKLYKSLNVPISRLDAENGFNMGRASEISRDELKFAKFIDKLRVKFSELFLQVLKAQLVLKGVMTEEEFNTFKDDIHFEYARDSFFAESKNQELLNNRLDLLGSLNEYIGKYYSQDWVRRNILRQSEEEIKIMDKQIKSEIETGQLDSPVERMY